MTNTISILTVNIAVISAKAVKMTSAIEILYCIGFVSIRNHINITSPETIELSSTDSMTGTEKVSAAALWKIL